MVQPLDAANQMLGLTSPRQVVLSYTVDQLAAAVSA